MLPFFFQHYDSLVDQYFIYDRGSTDGSLDILRSHPKTVVREFRVLGTSFVRAAQQFNNECWKQSRGKAEWVIVCNIDEHLHHPDWDGYLNGLPAETSLIVPDGYNMYCDQFPELTQQIRLGQRCELLDKPQMFRPSLIEEMNFHLGRHGADPIGAVQTPPERQVKLLHHKFMGLNYFKSRLSELRQGLRPEDIEKGWGYHYLWDERQKTERFQSVAQAASQVL